MKQRKGDEDDDDDDDDGDDKPKKKKGKQKEVACPPGYVVLERPNQYGSLCEPKEGLPKKEAEKCKFGMIGTPPNNCRCPPGKEFVGYKGMCGFMLLANEPAVCALLRHRSSRNGNEVLPGLNDSLWA